MKVTLLSFLISFLLFAIGGYLLSLRVKAPGKAFEWILLVVCLVASGYIGVNTKLVSLAGVSLMLNGVLQGFFFGIMTGNIKRKFSGR